MRHAPALAVILSLGVGTAALGQEFLIIPDSSNDIINTFNPFDGSLIQTEFINIGILDKTGSTPKDAIQVGNEIWVSDQLRDTVYRFDLSGALIAPITGGMDNIRGMEYANGAVYVSNSGDNNGAPGDAVVTFAPDGTNTGFFTTGGDPFDILDKGDGLYINDIANEGIDIFDYDGSFVSNFVSSDGLTGIDFPQQMAFSSSGTVLVAGFSSPAGLYEYDTDGTQLNYYDLGGLRGVYELGNGQYLFTDGDGVHTFDPATGAVVTVYDGGSGQYIGLVIPSPAGTVLLGIAGLAALRRRR